MSGRPIGYEKKEAKEEKQELDLIKTTNQILEAESRNINHIKKELKKEFLELEHLEHNLKILEKKLKSIWKLATKRDELMHEIRVINMEPESRIDIHKIENLLGTAQKLETEISQLCRMTHYEANKLLVDEKHELNEISGSKAKIEEISDKAKDIIAEIMRISKGENERQSELREIEGKLKYILSKKDVPPVGFKQKQ